MHVYSFEKMKEEVIIDLKNREAENKKRYYFKISLFENNKMKFKEENDDYIIENTNEVILRSIENKAIGDKLQINPRTYKKLKGTEFKYDIFRSCQFDNIEFSNCSFLGSVFSNCNFQNIVFENCDFYSLNGDISIFNNKTIFKDCCFKNCNMENSIFQNTSLYNSNFIHTSLKDSIISDTYLDKVYITDSDCRSLKIINPEVKEFKFDDNFLTKFDEYTFIDKIKIDKNYKKTYEIASKVYRGFASKFEANRLMDNSGEYYYLSKCMEHKSLNGINKIKSTIFWLLCGYGERPTYALIASLEIVLLFAIIYMITGLSVGGYNIDYQLILESGLTMPNLIPDFMKSLYFSIVTFTTVGYGDITPIRSSVFLSGVEMLLGVTMVGVWTATLARKITR
ncbi:MAG: pentapeptide repeat-containing protein [Romboutsia sp.]